MLARTYSGLWSKYRPALLKLMIDSEQEPQQYRLSSHEFIACNNGKKITFSFELEVAEGKIVSGTKGSGVAQDLLEVLRISPKANELLSAGRYHFLMNNQFILHIQKRTTLSQ